MWFMNLNNLKKEIEILDDDGHLLWHWRNLQNRNPTTLENQRRLLLCCLWRTKRLKKQGNPGMVWRKENREKTKTQKRAKKNQTRRRLVVMGYYRDVLEDRIGVVLELVVFDRWRRNLKLVLHSLRRRRRWLHGGAFRLTAKGSAWAHLCWLKSNGRRKKQEREREREEEEEGNEREAWKWGVGAKEGKDPSFLKKEKKEKRKKNNNLKRLISMNWMEWRFVVWGSEYPVNRDFRNESDFSLGYETQLLFTIKLISIS